MNILALDLGTKCGWALHTTAGKVKFGSADCSVGAAEGRGQRWLRFRAMLADAVMSFDGDIQAVYFEHVKRHEGALSAHVYGGFLAHLETWCELKRIPMVKTDVGTIKKNWTGKGNCKKSDMITAARAKGFNPADDNEADALAILALAMQLEGLFDEAAA